MMITFCEIFENANAVYLDLTRKCTKIAKWNFGATSERREFLDSLKECFQSQLILIESTKIFTVKAVSPSD